MTSGEAGERRDAEECDRPNDVQFRGAEVLGDENGKNERGEGQQYVECPHDHRVEESTDVPGCHAEDAADRAADGDSAEAHLEGLSSAVEDARHDVVAEGIGSQDVARCPWEQVGSGELTARRWGNAKHERPDEARRRQHGQHRGRQR